MRKGRLVVPEKSPLIIAAIVCVAVHWLCRCFTTDYFGNLCFRIPYISEVATFFTAFGFFGGSSYQLMAIPQIVHVILQLAFAVLLLVGAKKAHKTLKPLIAAWVMLALNPLLVWITTAIVISCFDLGDRVSAPDIIDIILNFILAGAIAALLILIHKGILKNKVALMILVAALFMTSYFQGLYLYLTEGFYWLFAIDLCVCLCALAPTVLVAAAMKNVCASQKENLELGE